MKRQHAKGLFSEGWLNVFMAILLLMFLFNSALTYAEVMADRRDLRPDHPSTEGLFIELPKQLRHAACFLQDVFGTQTYSPCQKQGGGTAVLMAGGWVHIESEPGAEGSFLMQTSAGEGRVRRPAFFIGYRREW